MTHFSLSQIVQLSWIQKASYSVEIRDLFSCLCNFVHFLVCLLVRWLTASVIHLVYASYNIYLLFPLRCDYLKITDEKNNTIEDYCGMKTGRHVYVTGRMAVLTFHSDYSFQRRGFLVLFTTVAIGMNDIWNEIF